MIFAVPHIVACASAATTLTVASGATAYLIGCNTAGKSSSVDDNATAVLYRTPGVSSKLYMRLTVNDCLFSSTVTLNINSVAQSQSLTIPLSTTGEFQDNVNTDGIVAGDIVNYQINAGAGGVTGCVISLTSMLFKGNAVTNLRCCQSNTNTITAGLVRSLGIVGNGLATSANEALTAYKVQDSFTVKNSYCAVRANSRADPTVFISRKNIANGNLSISIPATTTGLFEDTINSDSLAAGDTIGLQITTGAGAGTISVTNMTVDLQAVNNLMLLGSTNGLLTGIFLLAAGTTWYSALSGSLVKNATQTDIEFKSNQTFTAKYLTNYIGVNTITSVSNVFFCINGATATQSISIPPTTTGLFQDLVNTDIVHSGNELNYIVGVGSGGTSLCLNSLGILADYTPIISPVDAIFFAGD